MKKFVFVFPLVALVFFFSCKQTTENKANNDVKDITIDSSSNVPTILVYNFYGKHRCPSCIAIEKATIKALDSLYINEKKQGKIKQYSINIDDPVNSNICEKYQVWGSGLLITKVYKGQEKTIDLSGIGFKFALHKEDKFIEILKSNIDELLKN